MPTTYAHAQSLLTLVANRSKGHSEATSEEIPLVAAVGRITARDHVSPISTPTFDSSAMDGFAVVAATTDHASVDSPTILRIVASVVAGDPLIATTTGCDEHGLRPCIEIMTGARFPAVPAQEAGFDAIVRIEDAIVLNLATRSGLIRVIQITTPVKANTHKRAAGSDFRAGELVIRSRETVRPHHIMSLASVGMQTVAVIRQPKVGVWSTGHELLAGRTASEVSSNINDANGPWIEASMREFGADVDFLGVIDDNEASFIASLEKAMRSKHYDILVTTGAVSKGKVDFVPAAVEHMGGDTWFHGVSMRPGHPVLFATLPPPPPSQEVRREYGHPSSDPSCMCPMPFFGLPGNPIAVAACVRFLVLPYLRCMLGIDSELPITAKLHSTNDGRCGRVGGRARTTEHLDVFRHGHLSVDRTDGYIIRPSSDQSPAKMKPFSDANCWIHIPRGLDSSIDKHTVDCFLL